jgi:D-alanyl-D-alanine carboxypeptidase/D-alanyl-D-alanine-endopeptidase (penicillin-binding protein 4)
VSFLRSAALAVTVATAGCAAHNPPHASPPRIDPRRSAQAVRQLRADLSIVFNAPAMSRGIWAIDVRSLDTGERLFQMNAGKLMMPASNMKILTLAAAAETLRWDARFTTTLEAAGTIAGGTLAGDLVVRGGGDPTMNTRDGRGAAVFDEWAAALRAAGIEHVEGRVVGDDQAFDDESVGPGWSWDYLQYGYAAPVGALQYNEDVAVLSIQPAAVEADPAVVQLQAGSGLTLVNRAVTGAAGSAETIDYRRRIDRPVLEISGSVPVGSAALSRNVAVVNPTVFFAQSLKDALTARGIGVAGEAVDFDDVAAEFLASPHERRAVAATQSPTLLEIATVLMKVSQNLYAETLLKAIGASGGALGTTAGGRTAARAIFRDWTIPDDAYVIADGSGLSRYNYVSAEAIVTILQRMYTEARHRDAFVATLPIAGKDGTTASRMRRTRAEGNAVAKTGSIANVRTLSGYVRTRDGETLVFAMLANDFVIPAATVTWMADLGVETLANFTRR